MPNGSERAEPLTRCLAARLSAIRVCGRGEVAHTAAGACSDLVLSFPLGPDRDQCWAGCESDKCGSNQDDSHRGISSVRPQGQPIAS